MKAVLGLYWGSLLRGTTIGGYGPSPCERYAKKPGYSLNIHKCFRIWISGPTTRSAKVYSLVLMGGCREL